MGGTCSTHDRDVKCVRYVGRKTGRQRDHLEDLTVDGRIILEWM
jgi:hypothetical protein